MEDELQHTLEYWGKPTNDVVFQQDNDTKHSRRPNNGNITVFKWPTQSPDLNPIENLWHHLKKELGEYDEPAKSDIELWDRVQVEWEKIPMEECQK